MILRWLGICCVFAGSFVAVGPLFRDRDREGTGTVSGILTGWYLRVPVPARTVVATVLRGGIRGPGPSTAGEDAPVWERWARWWSA